MRNSTRKRSPPKPGIAPIHVAELLNGAGMTGFLSVLDPPVRAPHLREYGSGSRVAEPGQGLLDWFSEQAGSLFGQLRRQQEALGGIVEMARRWQGGAERLWCQAETARNLIVRQSGGLSP